MKKVLILLTFSINIITNAYCNNDTIYILPWFDWHVNKVIITDTITGNSIIINRKNQWPYRNNILIFDTSALVLEMKIKRRFSRKYIVKYIQLKGEKDYLNYSANNRFLYFGIRKTNIYNLYFINRWRGLI